MCGLACNHRDSLTYYLNIVIKTKAELHHSVPNSISLRGIGLTENGELVILVGGKYNLTVFKTTKDFFFFYIQPAFSWRLHA